MKEQVKMGLMAVIAIALVAIAAKMFMDSGDKGSANEIVSNTGNAATTANNSTAAFDPLSNNAETATAEIDNTPKTTIKFESYDHDFGDIKQDTENKKVFTFTNTGAEPLIIESAKGSCGCTVPNYPKNPIPPGEQGEIEVVYKPGKQKDLQNKNVTIVANTEPQQTILRIKANVEEIAPVGG